MSEDEEEEVGVDLRSLPGVQAFSEQLPLWRSFHQRLERFLFDALPNSDPSSISELLSSFQSSSEFDDPEDLLDVRGELVNGIAAAVSVERRSYSNLIAVVTSLNDPTFSYEVAEACLSRFPLSTSLFLLNLIESKLLDIYPIHRYVKTRCGSLTPIPGSILLYFLPELSESFLTSTIASWRKLSALTKSLICPPEIPLDLELEDADFSAFKALRATGHSASSILNAIRSDNVEEFVRLASGDFSQIISFSIYEQYLKFEYRFEKDEEDSKLKVSAAPTVCDAIALFEAKQCFAAVLETEPDSLLNASKTLVSTTKTGFLDRARESGLEIQEEPEALGRGLVLRTIGSEVAVAPEVVMAVLIGANISAFWEFAEKGSLNALFAEEEAPSLVHWIARGNAVSAFKLMLVKGKVNVISRPSNQRTFLHWAANYAAFDIVRLWVERLELNEGLGERDVVGLTPIEIAGAVGLKWERQQLPRLYELFVKVTERAANEENEDE